MTISKYIETIIIEKISENVYIWNAQHNKQGNQKHRKLIEKYN